MSSQTAFAQTFFALFAEAFGVAETDDAYFLDSSRAGLLPTIDTLSAELVSIRRSEDDATIAAHCGHVLFLLRFFAAHQRGETPTADWAGSWATPIVDEPAWRELRDAIRSTYDEIVAGLRAFESWPDPAIGAAALLLTHCAYHLGEIRQRIGWIG